MKHLDTSSSKTGTPVVVLCAAGTGIQMAQSVSTVPGLRFAGFLDDEPEKQKDGYHTHPVLGTLSFWRELSQKTLFISSLYSPKKNPSCFQVIRSLEIPESRWATIVDADAIVSSMAVLGTGCYVGPGAVIEPLVRLGKNCAVYGNVYIAHHSELGEYVLCANSVSIAGCVSIGSVSYIGANSTIREYTKIGSRAIIGMGSVVIQNVQNGQIVAGNPARPMRERSTSDNI